VEILLHLDLEVAAVQADGDGRVAAAQHVRDRGAAGAGSRGQRLPAPRSKIRARMLPSASGAKKLTFVRRGKSGLCSICGPTAERSRASTSAGSASAMAHCGLPIETCWNRHVRPPEVSSPVPSGGPPGSRER
jgi:hypothetical protein